MNSEKSSKYTSRIPVPVKKLNPNKGEKEASVICHPGQKKNFQITSTKDLKSKEPNGRKQIRNGQRLQKKTFENCEFKSITSRTVTKNSVFEKSATKLKEKNGSEICAKVDNKCSNDPVISKGEKENKLPVPKHIAVQKDIKFEASEKFKRMLLSERPFSPRMLNPGKMSFSCDRLSRYDAPALSDNPLRDLLEACSSIKRTRQTSSIIRKIQTEKPTQPSPMRESFYYTPGMNAKEELLKSLKALKEKKTLTASRVKKVTFNMNVEKFSPHENSFETPDDTSETPFEKAPKGKKENSPTPLIEVNEMSPDADKESSPEQSGIMAENNDFSLKICTPRPTFQAKSDDFSSKICTPRPIFMLPDLNSACFSSPELQHCTDRRLLKETAPITTPLVLKSLASSVFSPEADLPSVRLKLDFADEEKGSPRKTECLQDRGAKKIQGKDKENCGTFFPSSPSRNYGSLLLDKIETLQKKQEDQADMECYLNLMNENTPVICGRYLRNPVAVTLAEGDDMHFLPIKF